VSFFYFIFLEKILSDDQNPSDAPTFLEFRVTYPTLHAQDAEYKSADIYHRY